MALERMSAAWRGEYVADATRRERGGGDGSCVFCVLAAEPVSEASGVVARTSASYACLNAYPYGTGHLVVLPTAHVAELAQLSDDQAADLFALVRAAVAALARAYAPDGFNVGFNLGAAAGAGIPDHLHGHVLPRWRGDTNFMATIGETRVLPEDLATTWRRVTAAWSPGPRATDG